MSSVIEETSRPNDRAEVTLRSLAARKFRNWYGVSVILLNLLALTTKRINIGIIFANFSVSRRISDVAISHEKRGACPFFCYNCPTVCLVL